MYLLRKKDFPKVLPLLKKQEFDHTFSYAVITGEVKGDIYVDNNEKPSVALIKIFNGIHHLFGDVENNSFKKEVTNFFEEVSAKLEYPIVLFTTPNYEGIIDNWKINIEKKQRLSFMFSKEKFLKLRQPDIPIDYKIKKINKEIILKSAEYPESFYNLYWTSVTAFLDKCFGYCLQTDNNEIVCEVTSPSCWLEGIDIDITTNEAYRQKGLGKVAAHYFIKQALQMGKTPKWECDLTNEASQQLARNLGFVEGKVHPYYIIRSNN